MKFKFFEHTADIKFRAFGQTLNEVFRNSALAFSNSMTEEKVKEKIVKKIKVSGRDKEALLYNFLEELAYLVDAKDFIISKVKKISIKENKLEAELVGDKLKGYDIKVHIKAVTYNEMFVKKIKDKFVAQVVLDI